MRGAAGRRLLRLAAAVFGAATLLAGAAAGDALPAEDRLQVLAFGPWPPPPARDPGNRASGDAAAIAFGERLFHSPGIGGGQALRCATCHEPWRGYVDGRRTALGLGPGKRNTPTLWNVGHAGRWGWDGRQDTLWGQSLRPLLDPLEMGSSIGRVAAVVRADAAMAGAYRRAFGSAPPDDDAAVFADVGKALAAYEETLVSAQTPFDRFRDALDAGDRAGEAAYPAAARRGLRLFVGRARCAVCHAGPRFSDGLLHPPVAGAAAPSAPPTSAALIPFRRLGPYDDAASAPAAGASTAGGAIGWRTPSLREVAATAPYMHDGRIARLCGTLAPHAGDAAPAAQLTPAQQRDLVAFLRTLLQRPPQHDEPHGCPR